jgi:integrase
VKGHIRQRTKGSWEITIDAGKDPATGRRLRHFETVKGTKKGAQRRLAELLVSIEQGGYVRPQHLTLGEWLERWLASYAILHTSPRTAEGYQIIIRRHLVPSLGRVFLSQLQPQHIQEYYTHATSKGLSNRSILHHYRLLHKVLNDAVKQGLIARNIADAIDPPRAVSKEMTTLTSDEIASFLKAAEETPFHALFYTKIYTGLRRSEVLGLTWGNIDLDLCTLSVTQALHRPSGRSYVLRSPKSRAGRRRIDLPPSLTLVLRQYRVEQENQRDMLGKALTDDDFVFAHPNGTPWDPSTITHAFQRIIRNAALPHVRLHDLRHTHATLMLKAGVHPKIVSERLGHSNIGITLDTYSHVLPGLQEAAAKRFDDMMESTPRMHEDGRKMSAKCRQSGLDQKSARRDSNP